MEDDYSRTREVEQESFLLLQQELAVMIDAQHKQKSPVKQQEFQDTVPRALSSGKPHTRTTRETPA